MLTSVVDHSTINPFPGQWGVSQGTTKMPSGESIELTIQLRRLWSTTASLNTFPYFRSSLENFETRALCPSCALRARSNLPDENGESHCAEDANFIVQTFAPTLPSGGWCSTPYTTASGALWTVDCRSCQK